jgi:hypothetical protein
MAAVGVTWVRGFNGRAGVAGLTPFAEAGLSVSGFLMWSPDSRQTLPVSDLAAFRRYVSEQVNLYKGQVHHWEVWNEPPNFTEDESPVSYGRVVAAAYDAAKSVDPTVQIGLAAKSTHVNFLAESIDGGARGKFDFISLHPYETAGLVPQGWEGPFLGIVPSVRAMLRDKDPDKVDVPVWFTEVGLEVAEAGRSGVSPEVQADTLVKLYTMGIAQGASHVHWFDPQDSEGKTHGLLRGDGTPRPAHHALSTLTRTLGRAPEYRGFLAPAADTFGFLFRGAEGHALVAWSRPGAGRSLHFVAPIAVMDPRTGQSRSTDHVTLTPAPLVLIAARDSPVAGGWQRAARAGRLPTWDGGKLNAMVSLSAGQKPRGLHMIDPPDPTIVNGVAEFDLSGRRDARFAVDPLFLNYESLPIRITAVVRGHNRGNPGFNLKYENRGPISAANGHGMVSTGGWQFVKGTSPITLSWTIADDRFVGKYGAHFAIDCDGPESSDFSILSISVTKL